MNEGLSLRYWVELIRNINRINNFVIPRYSFNHYLEYFYGEEIDYYPSSNGNDETSEKSRTYGFSFAPPELLSDYSKDYITEAVQSIPEVQEKVRNLATLARSIKRDIEKNFKSIENIHTLDNKFKDKQIIGWWNSIFSKQMDNRKPPYMLTIMLYKSDNEDVSQYIESLWATHPKQRRGLSPFYEEGRKFWDLLRASRTLGQNTITNKCHLTSISDNKLYDINDGKTYKTQSINKDYLLLKIIDLLDLKETDLPCMICYTNFFSSPEIIIDLKDLSFKDLYEKIKTFFQQKHVPNTPDPLSLAHPCPRFIFDYYYNSVFRDRAFLYSYGKKIIQYDPINDVAIRKIANETSSYLDLVFYIINHYEFTSL